MGVLHFLNVLNGDCSIIQHPSGRLTVIDVNNAYHPDDDTARLISEVKALLHYDLTVKENFQQKKHPVNPIEYLKSFNISSVFRFILTHPDMDHLGGIKAFFEAFEPGNFWDTDNRKGILNRETGEPTDNEDWFFYKALRDGNPTNNPKRLTLYSGAVAQYYNRSDDGASGGDGLYILAPTEDLINAANECSDYNDASYVILYRTAGGGKILFSGDSHDKTWEHILENYEEDVSNVDLLIAPHHGRKSGRSYDFLDVVSPALTFFGNARSNHLAYSAWTNRSLPYITNNQAGCMVVDADVRPMKVYVTNEKYAESINSMTLYEDKFKAYYWGEVAAVLASAQR